MVYDVKRMVNYKPPYSAINTDRLSGVYRVYKMSCKNEVTEVLWRLPPMQTSA